MLKGFKYGFKFFKFNYAGPRSSCAYDDVLSIKQSPEVATKKLINEIELGRMADPFKTNLYLIFAVYQLGLFQKRRMVSDL